MTDPYSLPPSSAKAKVPAPTAILSIVLVYAAFSALWILLSDKAVQLIFSDPAQILMVSTLKGWLFVIVTSLLLYGLMRRLSCSGEAATPASVVSLRPLALPLTLLVMAIVALTAEGIVHAIIRQKDKEVARLQAIADLKTHQIADWLGERRGDALFVQDSQPWSELYFRWRDNGDVASRDQLQNRLDRFRKANFFQGVLLLDGDGNPVWDSQWASFGLALSLRVAVRQAAIDHKVNFFEPYRDQADRLHLDFIAPLPAIGDRPGPVVVLRADPADYLFPILQTWPVPSPSGETLLFRRDGDQILFLNELRHRSGTAVKLREAVSAPKLLASQVVRGAAKPGELVEGVDYRGVPVMGVARAIPGTDWFLVAKLDQAEVYSEIINDILWITLAGLLALFMTVTGAFLFRQRQELAFSLRERHVQADKLRALQLLDAIAAGSTDAIFVKDPQGRYLLFNQAAALFVGKSAEEVLGRDDTEIFPPAQAALVMANDRKVMEDDHIATLYEELDTIDGQVVFLSTKGPIHDGGGKVTGIFGISRDITERRRAEEALLESETMYRSLFENMLNGFAYCRMLFDNGQPQDFIYLKVNGAFERLTGLAGVVGRKVTEVIPGIRESDSKLLEIYGRVAMGGGAERFEMFIEAMRMWFWISVYSPKREYFVAVFDGITERKQAEAALRESEASLARAQAIAHMGSWRLDIKTGEVAWSAETYRIFDIPAGTPINLDRFFACIHPEDRARVVEARNVALTGESYNIEYRILVRGEVRWVHGQGELGLDGAGQPVVSFGVVQDITERKRAEEERKRLQTQLLQAQKMESIGRLAGGVAHDFNNMLSVIIGYAELAQTQDNLPREIDLNLEEIKKAAKRSADLTRQLLAFARKQTIAPEVLDLNDSTAGMLKMLRRLIGEDIELVWIPGAHLWPVRIDPAQIDQILANLAVNARDAIAGVGKVTIETKNITLDQASCAAHADFVPGDFVMLAVSDNGCGMEQEVAGRVFEPFFTTKGVGRGTGLGLATVYGIVKQNEGLIDVWSEPGKGTTFKIYLPKFLGTAAEASPGRKPETPGSRGETVLLVEDEKTVLQMIQAMLVGLGYTVLTADTPDQALRLIESGGGECSLLITDVVMPGMNGRELVERIRESKPGLKCLFMSGYTADVIAQQGVMNQGIHFIQKPFTIHDLAVHVRAALDG